MIIKPKKIEVVKFSQQLEVPDTVKPKAVQIDTVPISVEDPLPELLELNKSIQKDLKPSQECVTDIVNNWKSLTSGEINKAVADLFIKFNTSPKTYQKSDYLLLLHILKALADLHDINIIELVDSWQEVVDKSTLPGGDLIKETFELLQGEVGILQTDVEHLESSKQDTLIAGDGINITDNVISSIQADPEWGNIIGDISDQEDLQAILQDKANVEDIPTAVSELDNDMNYLVPEDIEGKQDVLTAGVGIDITNNVISNTQTSAEWGNITGDIEDQSDLQEVLDDFVTSEEVHSVDDIEIYVTCQTPIIDKTEDSQSSFSIDPNKMYMFGNRTNLTISFNTGLSDIVNEYMFQFTSGSTATTLVVPNTVVWLKDPDIQTGKKYMVSIENNMGIIGEWDNE